MKALHLVLGQEGWGQVVARLLKELPGDLPDGLLQRAKVLDNFYIPTRYASGHAASAPFGHCGPLQSEEAVRYAGEILEFLRSQMA